MRNGRSRHERARATLVALGVGIALLSALGAAPGLAQGVPGMSAPGPVATGTIRGRVIHDQRPEAAAGVEVLLYGLRSSSEPFTEATRTDAQGEFRFEDIFATPGTIYLIAARHAEVAYGTRIEWEPGRDETFVELPINDPTESTADLSVESLGLLVDRSCEALRVTETHILRNSGERVLYVSEARRGEASPLLVVELPAEAGNLMPPLGNPASVSLEGRNLLYWGPIYPDTHTLEFSYTLPEGPVNVRRTLPRGADRVVVSNPDSWPAPMGAPFTPAPRDPMAWNSRGGTRQSVLSAMPPGAVLEFDMLVPPRGSSGPSLALTETRIWLETDDAIIGVNEQHAFEVPDGASAHSNSGSPLLCIEIPDDAEGLQSSNASLALGLILDPSGQVALRGPLPPGPGTVNFQYRLPVEGEPARFTRRFTQPLPVLSVLVSDTSLVASSKRLHRRRSERSGDRVFMYLEGFAIEPDERVEVELARITPSAPLPQWTNVGLVGLAAAGAVIFMTAPLYRRRESDLQEIDGNDTARRERDYLYAAIEDIDHDFETGKVSEADHARMRSELRAQAVELIRAEQADAPETAPPRTDPGNCPACGTELTPGAKFCAQCGARASTGDPPG
ncbi:zinc-ribbon domain-containing protein [Myxococcota bacterium]|nr:zinc-ribbon domain-containing protein [Myxococcota bacterium]